MEMWIPLAGIVVAFSALWWKITTSLVTKTDLNEARRQIDDRFKIIDDRFNRVENDIRHDISDIKNDIRELRQLWTTHLTEHHRTREEG